MPLELYHHFFFFITQILDGKTMAFFSYPFRRQAANMKPPHPTTKFELGFETLLNSPCNICLKFFPISNANKDENTHRIALSAIRGELLEKKRGKEKKIVLVY